MEKNIAEREINLIDMFWATCLQWRQILLWAVIFAVLAGGASYFKSARAAKKAAEPTAEIALEDIELDAESKNNANAYLEYKQIYGDQIIYNETAPLMQLDANGFYRDVLTYYVDNHFAVEYPLTDKNDTTDAIIEAYKAKLRSEEFMEGLAALTGSGEKTVSYAKELVDSSNKYGEIDAAADESGIMILSVYGANEQDCKDLAQLVKESISSSKRDVIGQLGEHDITLIEDSCNYVSDVTLLKYQQENISKLSTYANTIRDMKSRLTEDELSYVDTYEREYIQTAEETEKEEISIQEVTVSKKLIAVGFVGGAALAFFVAVLLYLFNIRLRLEDDFEMIYGVKLLGSVIVKDDQKKKWFAFIDQLFIKMRHFNKRYFTTDEAVSMVAAGIRIGAKKTGASKVYVTGAAVGKEEKSVIEQLAKELKKAGIELVSGKPILYDAEALEQSAEIGFVVLFERTGISLYSEIAEEIEVCAHQGMNLLGAVVVAQQSV